MPKHGGNQGGRPNKLTPEKFRNIIQLLKEGNFLETAASASGVPNSTVREWLRHGKNHAGEKPEPPPTLASTLKSFTKEQHQKGFVNYWFSDAIEKASAHAEASMVKSLDYAAKTGQWQATAWRLERRFGERWGRKTKLEHSGPGGQPIKIDHNQSPEELLAAADELRARLKSDG